MLNNKTGHLTGGRAHSASHPDWAQIAEDLTDISPLLTGRDDITVHISSRLTGESAGRFRPDANVIELDADRCFPDIPPTTVRLTNMADHARFPRALGVFAHMCSHAAHTRWRPGPDWPGPVRHAAALLEDLRAEAAHLARRRVDWAWLRAAPLVFDVPDLTELAQPAIGLWQAASAAALCLGRIDTGLLDATDPLVSEAQEALTGALGPRLFEELAAIWGQALTVADTDTAAMEGLARAWCAQLTEPNEVVNASSVARQDELARAVWLAADALEAAAPLPLPLIGTGSTSTPPCSDLFAYTAPPRDTRAATGPERSAATRLAKALATAGRRPRTATTVHTQAPPGRLNMRGGLAGAAQRAAGVPVTAKPWKRTVRKHLPDPAASVGIALDVSVSMGPFFAPATTAAWMLARAAKQTGGKAAAATFGLRVRTLIAPGKVPDRIPEPDIEWGTNHLDVVIDALDTALGLGKSGPHARLLFLITDGWIGPHQRWTVMDQCERLQQAGCAVIQITPDLAGQLEFCRPVEVTDPLDALNVITEATVAELRAAARRER
jgi:hypothetical protein